MGGISNFQIEDAIEKIGDEDLSVNFVGVFLSNCMNKFINPFPFFSQTICTVCF